MRWYDYVLKQQSSSEVVDSRFDVLYIREDFPNIEIAVAKGKKVMYVRYHGNAKPSDVIEHMAKILTK